MTLGMNTAAVEWVHAYLRGLDPQRIPLTREAFVPHRYPRTHFSPNDILTLDKHLCNFPGEISIALIYWL
jgi:hypothetical protein